MGLARENLEKISAKFTGNAKVEAMFSTNNEGKDTPWEMTFQLTLDGEDPFNLAINGDKASISDGVASNAGVVLTGDPNSIVKICNGQGDFTHAISRLFKRNLHRGLGQDWTQRILLFGAMGFQ